MFWSKKKVSPTHSPAGREPLTEPAKGRPLLPTDAPGYYPGYRVLSQQKYWDAATRELIHKRMGDVTPVRFFSADEARTMAAVVDRILPQEDRTAAYRIDILPGIDKRLHVGTIEGYRFEDMPPDQECYRIAAAAFEQMAKDLYGKCFHELPTLDREKLIQSIHDGVPAGAHKLWERMNVERFWTLLVSDCCSVYYAHPYAWDEIGFGGPAYPRGYMRLEEGEAEPWEVDEQRYAWNAPADTLSDREKAHGTSKQNSSSHGQAGTH